MSVSHSIGIAGLRVVTQPDTVRTVLGSCVGIALFDRAAHVGGLAHIILPSSAEGAGDRGKFADTAVDWLLDEVVRAGGLRGRIQAKIAGGARMFGPNTTNGLGERNVAAVKERLHHQGVSLVAEDTGGEKGRKMLLDPATGNVEVQFIGQDPRVI
ncbi:MAG: chemotaxis protein CheD [Phycisphaerae bacterium]